MLSELFSTRSVLRVLFALVLLMGALYLLQDSMLYYPGSYRPSAEDLASASLRSWPAASDDYRGFVSAGPEGPSKGTVVVFHGNAGTAFDRAYYMEALTPLGYRVVLAEYPGYGGRPGRPGEQAFVADGIMTVQKAQEAFGGPLLLLGESLGCGVAAAVAKQLPSPASGIILITPWDTLLSVAKDTFPWLPVRWLLKDTYDSIGNLKGFPGPIAVVGAERDDVIPVRHAEELYRSLDGAKRFWTVRSAGHNDWFDRVDRAWWREVMVFMGSSGS